MRFIRPFDPRMSAGGTAGPWLVDPAEGFGVSIRLRTGERQLEEMRVAAATTDRFALVLGGELQLSTLEWTEGASAPEGAIVFIPAGAAGSLRASAGSVWLEINGSVPQNPAGSADRARVIRVDPSRFEGRGFLYQSVADRSTGSRSMRVNWLQVDPGAGSPDFHIHAFAQLYVILEGEMTVDIGRTRHRATRHSLVCLPPGVVHRNFNGSASLERHISLLVPEPTKGEILDYAVEIHEHEAELMKAAPK